jgi:hypothetical protein
MGMVVGRRLPAGPGSLVTAKVMLGWMGISKSTTEILFEGRKTPPGTAAWAGSAPLGMPQTS